MKKRLLSFLLCLAILAGQIPAAAFAAEDTPPTEPAAAETALDEQDATETPAPAAEEEPKAPEAPAAQQPAPTGEAAPEQTSDQQPTQQPETEGSKGTEAAPTQEEQPVPPENNVEDQGEAQPEQQPAEGAGPADANSEETEEQPGDSILPYALSLAEDSIAVVDESDNIISRAGATIAAPVGGETPSFTATSEDPSKYSVKVYNWIDLERNMNIKAYELADPDNYYYNYTFEAGKEYAVVIGFEEIEGGPQLSTSTQFFINGNQSTRTYGHFRARRYDFTATGSGGGTVTPTYTATVDSIDFGSVKLGYKQPDYQKITINNTGNSPLSVNVDSFKFITGSEYFQLATFNSLVSNIPVGGQCTSWFIRPNANLSIGTYTATVQFQDSKGEMSAPATATVTFKVEDHDYDTTKWKYDADSHWNPCKDSGCNAKGNIAEHDRNKEVGGYDATFDADGKTPDLYCSVCNRKMQSGEAIAAGKYIRESKATMSPAAIDSNMCANDLVFTSLEPTKYTVRQFNGRVFDLTDKSLNTSNASGYGYTYPMEKKFISGHQYAIEFLFSAVAPYAYNENSELHWSTFTLNGAATIRGGTATFDGATNRRIVLTAGAAPEVPVTSVSLPKTLSLIKGEFRALTATVMPDNATNKAVVWSSDNESIAMVDQNGSVEAKAPGTAIITAKSAADTSKFDTCTVTVVKEHGITVTGGTATVDGTAVTKAVQGTVVQLTANIPESERFARWETISGSTSVTFENANSSTTTFTMPDGSVAIKAVTNKLVNAPIVNTGLVYNSHNQIGVNANTGYTLGGIYAATNAGSYTATATLDTGYIWADGSTNVKSINWSISKADQNAPTGLSAESPLNADGKGKINGTTADMEYNTNASAASGWVSCTGSSAEVAPGTYYVRFKADTNHNVSDSTAVVVPVYVPSVTHVSSVSLNKVSLQLTKGESEALSATISPADATDKSVHWESDNADVADVDNTGNVTAKAKGTATITVTTTDGGKTASCSVTVVEKATVPTAHTLTYNGNKQTGVSAGTGYILGGTYAATNAGSYTATATLDTGYIWADGSTDVKSINWSISKADQNAPTGLAGVKPTAEGANDGKITGVNNQMEYRKAGTGSYSICTDSEITGLVAGNYEVRFTETANFNASPSVTVTVPAGSTVVAKYTLTITNGTGSGDYAENAAVTITANAPAADKVFDKWVLKSGSADIADENSATTTVTTKATAATIEATYKDAPPSHTHSYGTDWKYDDTNHWHECECGDKADISAHSASEWIVDTAATETADGAKHKECTVCKKVLETATIPALVKINAEHLTAAKPVKGAAAAKATTTDSTYYVANTEWTAADGTILTVGQNFNAGTVYTVKITLKAKENNVFAADSTYNKIEGKDAKLETAVTGHTDSVILTYTFDATEGVAYNITKGANGVWVKGSTDTLSFTADGEYAKFTSVKIDGAELAAENYTAAAGSTVITLKNEYLSTLAVGAHTIAIIYTDGDCSTNFTVHQHTYGAWSSDDTHHWHECTDASCTNIADKAEHTFEWKIDVPASQASTGTKHEECTVCGKKRNENTVIDKLPGSGSGSHHSSNNSNNNNNTGTEAAAPEAAAPAPAASAPVTTTTSARTGDSSNLIGWLTVLLISGGAAGAWYTVAKKKKEQ